MSFSVRNERSGLEYNGTSLEHACSRSGATSLRPSFLRMVARHPALQPRGAARCSRRRRRDDRSGRVPRRARLLARVRRRLPGADGRGDLVDRPGSACSVPGALLRALLPQPRHAHASTTGRSGARSAAARALRRAADRALRDRIRAATRRCTQRARGARRRAGQRTRRAEPSASTTCSSPAMPTRRCALLADPTPPSARCWARCRYQRNEVVLHTDTSLLPRAPPRLGGVELPRAAPSRGQRVALTYNMNILQGLERASTFCVTLNRSDDDRPARVLQRLTYHHPLFTPAGVAAQQRHAEINGVQPHATSAARTGATAFTRTAWSARSRRCNASNETCAAHAQRDLPGWLEHRRYAPRRARVPLPALHGVPRSRRARRVFAGAGCGRRGGAALARFDRADHLGDPARAARRGRARPRGERTGARPRGPDPAAHAPALLRLRASTR